VSRFRKGSGVDTRKRTAGKVDGDTDRVGDKGAPVEAVGIDCMQNSASAPWIKPKRVQQCAQ
jgi:hypothetical protein